MNGSPESFKDKIIYTELGLMNLKTNLKRLLSERNLNAVKLCKATGIPKSTISDWMLGNSPKNIKQVKAVADYFGLTVDALVFSESAKELEKNPEKAINGLINFGNFDVYLKKKN